MQRETLCGLSSADMADSLVLRNSPLRQNVMDIFLKYAQF